MKILVAIEITAGAAVPSEYGAKWAAIDGLRLLADRLANSGLSEGVATFSPHRSDGTTAQVSYSIEREPAAEDDDDIAEPEGAADAA